LLTRVFRAFKYRDFRLMWLGACTSSIGTWMQKLAQAWLVCELSKSPFLLGLDAFLAELPIFLFSLVGGAIADRHDRRHLLLFSQYVQMACAFALALLVALGQVQVWHILALSFVSGFGQAFGAPAYQALLPSLVPLKDLSNAIALNSIQFNLARVVGPVLGGLALTHLGAAWCFGLNGFSFIPVIITIMMVRARYVPAKSSSTLIASMRQGLSFVRAREGMRPLVVLAFLMTMLGVPISVFLPVFASEVFHQGPNAYTVLLSTFGAGSIVGALGVAALTRQVNQGRTTLYLLIVLGVVTGAFALSTVMALSLVFLFIAGACLVAVFSLVATLVQEITSDAMRGRVMSVYNVAFRGGMPAGSLVTGALVPHTGAPAALAANGFLLCCLGFFYLFAHRGVARLGAAKTAVRIGGE